MTDELKQWEYDKGYDKGQIDILEKIKEEILTKNPKFTIGCEMKMCLEIIDNYISKLKGE